MASSTFDLNRTDSRLRALYESKEGKQRHYDNWADSYDADLLNDLDYVAHLTTSNVFAELLPDKQIRILDVACGTGLVGKTLNNDGYQLIDGTDFSSEMIRVANIQDVYNQLFQHDFTTPLHLTDKYDALICVGLFAFTTPGIEHLVHVINSVKPNGICVITINGAAWETLNLEEPVRIESEKHGFEILEIRQAEYIRSQHIDCRILIIRAN